MGQYRLYLMNRFSGHIDHVREFEAVGDSEAIGVAEGWADGAPMELWDRHHKLKRWSESALVPTHIHG